MSIKIDLVNQVRQTSLPAWKPLLPLFEAVMNSFQAIKDAELPTSVRGRILIEVERRPDLFAAENPPMIGFRVTDNGIGLDDDNFDSFNTAYSTHKIKAGGKGLGRFTWLKAFDEVKIDSTFRAEGGLWSRSFIFDEHYDLDDRGLPHPTTTGAPGTTIELVNLRPQFAGQCPRLTDVLVQKLIEHFILVFLEPSCPNVIVHEGTIRLTYQNARCRPWSTLRTSRSPRRC